MHGVRLEAGSIDDLFQEVIASLLDDGCRRLKSYKGLNGCSFASWLRQVTVNATIDHLRRNRKRTFSIDEQDDEELSFADTLASNEETASESAAEKERLSVLTECIQRLETEDRFFVELHIMRGFALSALQDLFTVERGAVDMRKNRIIQRLRECFKAKGVVLA
jgi:RNA polymerase sigma-70 factor (ECF subfamily)